MSRPNRRTAAAGSIAVLALVLASCGGGSNGASAGTSSNSKPSFTSATTASIPENDLVAYTATASDPDSGDTLSFTISGGADSALFSISASSGQLSFKTAPDFENPADSGVDNVYDVKLTVSDGHGGSATQDVAITVTDVSSLELEVTFPTPNAELGGGVSEITVSGNILDAEDGVTLPSDVQFIDVNGVMATQSLPNPSRWSADIPVSGPNEQIDVTARPASGPDLTSSFQVTNQVDIVVNQTVVDAAGNRAIVATNTGMAIGIDLTTGIRSVVSSDTVGTGPGLPEVWSMVIDPASHRLFANCQLTAIYSVDLDNGNRQILSSSTVGTGPTFTELRDMALDVANGRLVAVDETRDAVFGIDLVSGNRTILSDATTGAGTALVSPSAIAFDDINARALVMDWTTLYAVDLNTGDRTVISDYYVNGGPALVSPRDLVFDAANNRVLVPLENPASIVAIDLATGDRTFMSDAQTGNGPMLVYPVGLARDTTPDDFLVTDQSRQALLRVSTANGDRNIVSSNAVGSGETRVHFDTLALTGDAILVGTKTVTNGGLFSIDENSGDKAAVSNDSVGNGVGLADPKGLAVSESENRAIWYGSDVDGISVVSIDLQTGDRTLISDVTRGSGPDLAQTVAGDTDATGTRGIVLDSQLKAVYGIDLATGDRTLISDSTRGGGATLFSPSSLVVEPVYNRALVTDLLGGLVSVSLATGFRTIISDSSTGSGPPLTGGYGVDVDSDSDLAYVVLKVARTVMSVNLTTGERSVVASDSVGRGLPLDMLGPIQIDARRGRLFVTGSGQPWSLKVIDIATGDRAIASR